MSDFEEMRNAIVRALMHSVDEDLENLLTDDSAWLRASSSSDE